MCSSEQSQSINFPCVAKVTNGFFCCFCKLWVPHSLIWWLYTGNMLWIPMGLKINFYQSEECRFYMWTHTCSCQLSSFNVLNWAHLIREQLFRNLSSDSLDAGEIWPWCTSSGCIHIFLCTSFRDKNKTQIRTCVSFIGFLERYWTSIQRLLQVRHTTGGRSMTQNSFWGLSDTQILGLIACRVFWCHLRWPKWWLQTC